MGLRIEIATRTHRGRLRASNQDAVLAIEGPDTPDGADALVVVADGMGGLPAGDVASRLAIESLRESVERTKAIDAAPKFLRNAIVEANVAVYEDSRDVLEHRGMGTTLTAALMSAGSLVIGHVGDSRAYLLRGGQLRLLSVDHTWVQAGIDAGTLTAEQAAVHPYRNMLTRALGLEEAVEAMIVEQPLTAGDTVLVCSDGLHGEVADTDIARALDRATAAEAARELEELALAMGGTDNVTVGVMKVR